MDLQMVRLGFVEGGMSEGECETGARRYGEKSKIQLRFIL